MDKRQFFLDLKKYKTIIIHRHQRPDLDALGSQVGLYNILKDNLKDTNIYMVGDESQKYSFIGKMDEIEDSKYNGALAIILDVSVENMVSDLRYKLADKVWVIDHHKNECDITENWLCDTTKAAAAEYITELFLEKGYKISSVAATALFGGIVTDSGRFMYGAKVSNTLRIAADLLDLGANQKFIYDNIYKESLKDREMKNFFSQRINMKGGVAWLCNDEKVFDKYPVEFNDISRGMLSLMSGIDEIKIWCNFTYDKVSNTVKCEFRSRDIPIVDIAKSLGGGGHAMACGATIESFKEVDSIIDSFIALLK